MSGLSLVEGAGDFAGFLVGEARGIGEAGEVPGVGGGEAMDSRRRFARCWHGGRIAQGKGEKKGLDPLGHIGEYWGARKKRQQANGERQTADEDESTEAIGLSHEWSATEANEVNR